MEKLKVGSNEEETRKLEDILQLEISTTSQICLDFGAPNSDRLGTALWVAVGGLRRMCPVGEGGWRECEGFLEVGLGLGQQWREWAPAERGFRENLVSACVMN